MSISRVLFVINPVKIYRLEVADIIVSLGLISPLGVYMIICVGIDVGTCVGTLHVIHPWQEQ